MGTTAEKGAYTLQTKSLLKQKINNLGGEIDNETTFRQYANQLQNVYDNYPKTSYQEGTSITLENCNKGKLDFEDGKVGYGQTSQDSTEGYNLLNPEYLRIWNNNNYVQTITYPNVDSSTDYTLYFAHYTGDAKLFEYDENDTLINEVHMGGTSANPKRYKFTTSSTTAKIGFYAKITTDGTATIDYAQPMLYKGHTDEDFEPYTNGASPNPSYPFPIQSVTGNQVVRVRGIQLFNKNDYLQGYAYMGSEKVQNANWGIAYIPCQANETFTISGLKGYANTYIAQTDTSKTFVSNLAQRTSSSTQYTITSTQTGYIGVTFLWNEVGEGSELDIMMINEGSTAKPYEPYYTPITKTLALGDRKVFEGDYFWIDKNTGKKYHHHSKTEYAFTGQEGFSKSQSYPGGYYRGWDLMDGVNNAPFLCTHAKYVSSLSDYVVGTCYSDTSCSLRLGDAEELPTTDSFKALLAQLYANGTPVTIVYQLATETDEEITDTLAEQIDEIDNLQSITGTTIIESNGDLPLIIKVRALKGGE